MMKKKKILYNNKWITGIDLTLSVIVLTTFVGIIIGLMVNNYRTSLEIQKSANAMSYATMILEKVDEKSYEKVTDDFLSTISGEISMDSDYDISFNVSQLDDSDYVKKVTIKVSYVVNNQRKDINISKLKIKEI